MIPQLIYLALVALGLGASLAKNGEPKKGKESFLTSLIAAVFVMYILYKGGFFNVFFN